MELATCDKYYDKVLERFPLLTKKQVEKIIKHGLCSVYLLNLYGGDVLLRHPKYVMYFGKLFNDNLVFTKYALIKWKIKLRIKYKKQKRKYDGYYYFGLTDELFNEKYVKARKKRAFRLDGVMFHKILEELTLDRRVTHFFRMPYPDDCGFTMYKKDYIVRNAEYICRRTKDNIIEPVSYERNRDKCVKRRPK